MPDLKPASTTTVLPTKHSAETIRNADNRFNNNDDNTNEESNRDDGVSNNTIDIVMSVREGPISAKKLGGNETQVEGNLVESEIENRNEARVGRQKEIFAVIKDFVRDLMTTTG